MVCCSTLFRLPSAATFNESIFPGVVSCDFKFFELLGSEVIKADVNLKVPLKFQRLVISLFTLKNYELFRFKHILMDF